MRTDPSTLPVEQGLIPSGLVRHQSAHPRLILLHPSLVGVVRELHPGRTQDVLRLRAGRGPDGPTVLHRSCGCCHRPRHRYHAGFTNSALTQRQAESATVATPLSNTNANLQASSHETACLRSYFCELSKRLSPALARWQKVPKSTCGKPTSRHSEIQEKARQKG